MSRKTFWRGIRFVLALALSSVAGWCKTPQETERVTISIFNDAGAAAEVLSQAEKEASRVFRQAGIEVNWLNCGMAAETVEESGACAEALYPEHLHLRIARKALTLKGEAMGISFLDADGRGCCADVFYGPMEELHKSDGADVAILLGHVTAHEVGHLLLGTNSHAAVGIMRALWTPAELASSRAGMLVFTEREARQMKERLSGGPQISKVSSQSAVEHVGD